MEQTFVLSQSEENEALTPNYPNYAHGGVESTIRPSGLQPAAGATYLERGIDPPPLRIQ